MKKIKTFITTEGDRREAMEAIRGLDLTRAPFVFMLGKHVRRRSNQQNRWFWAWANLTAEHTGMTPMEVHDEWLRECGEYVEVKTLRGGVIMAPKGTSQMNTVEFTEFLDKVHAYTLDGCDLDLPFPENDNFDVFMVNYAKSNFDDITEDV
jgi:hypothetical protein